jgi:PhnB protein
MRAEPYLYFDGHCEEAVKFYRHTIGAEVVAMVRFKDGGAPAPAGAENKLMHLHLRIGESTVLASDGQCRGAPSFQGFSLSLSAAGDTEAERLFAALSDGGSVKLALTSTPFASRFGMVTDRFGVLWTVVSEEQSASANR